ncbi:hypothetical protein PCK1_001252 [Pneumocystis canis]|nr:hypothetical protein PCK1_001252 [Pneumocystis canis]
MTDHSSLEMNVFLSSLSSEKNEYLSVIYKRLRAYLKKKSRLDRLEQWNQEDLNEDQRTFLRNKDQVLAPLRELEMLARQLIALSQAQQAQMLPVEPTRPVQLTQLGSIQAEDPSNGLLTDQPVEKEVLETGRVRILVGFLKHASIIRHTPTPQMDYNAAVERVLQQVYEADEISINIVEKLYRGSDEYIDQSQTVTYRQMKQHIESQWQPEPTPSPPLNTDTYAFHPSESRDYDSADLRSNESMIPGKKMYEHISFLNKSEIEGTSLKESLATHHYTPIPMNPLTDVPYSPHSAERGVFTSSGPYGLSNSRPTTWEPYGTHPLNAGRWDLEKQEPLTSFEAQSEGKTRRMNLPGHLAPENKGRERGSGDYSHREALYHRNNEYIGRGRRKKGFENKGSNTFERYNKKGTRGMESTFSNEASRPIERE